MATFTWEVYSDTPAWHGIGSNKFVFSGSPSDLSEPITVGEWQLGSHLGDGSPGADQCGANHMPNVKYVSNTQFDGGAGVETLNDVNLVATECTLRIKFTDASPVAISGARFYAYDGTTVTEAANGVEAYAFEQGVSATEWTQICDDSGSIGGDNDGERLDLEDQVAATEHYYYIAVSARPEAVGEKTEFDFGIALTYS